MKPPVFILGTGRCGSTLVQRILNTYPDVTIWGEHGGFLRLAAEQYFRILEQPGNVEFIFAGREGSARFTRGRLAEEKGPDRWQAWLNWFSPADVTRLFRDHVLSFFRPDLLDDDPTWGFKEIRYGTDDRVIEFLAKLFPDAIFVFLARNGFDTVTSQLMSWHHASRIALRLERLVAGPRIIGYARQWVARNRALLDWHRSGKIHSYWVAFEDLVGEKPVLDPVLSALGKTFGEEQRGVLRMAEGRGDSVRDGTWAVNRSRILGPIPMAVTDLILGNLNEDLGYKTPERIGWSSVLRSLGRARGAATGRLAISGGTANRP